MSSPVRLALAAAALAVAAAPLSLAPAAGADPDFGGHVSECAQAHHLGAAHHPGMHRGASGWDGMPCHDPA